MSKSSGKKKSASAHYGAHNAIHDELNEASSSIPQKTDLTKSRSENPSNQSHYSAEEAEWLNRIARSAARSAVEKA